MFQPRINGAILSHVEAIYRPEDRDLAIALFEALRCQVIDTGSPSLAGSSYLMARPDPGRPDSDDVIYLSQMTDDQAQLENCIRELKTSDAALMKASRHYADAIGSKPYGFSHIAIVYPDYASLEDVLDGLEDRLVGGLEGRVMVKTFRNSFEWESLQTFVYTDVAVAGISQFGQVYELSAYGPYPK